MTATPTPKVTLVTVTNAQRLQCSGCHRFVGVIGASTVECPRCEVVYIREGDGTYRAEEAA